MKKTKKMEKMEESLPVELDDSSLQNVQGGLDTGQKIGIGIGSGLAGAYAIGGTIVALKAHRKIVKAPKIGTPTDI